MTDSVKVAPSILAADFLNLQADVDRVRDAEFLHYDVMDGHFVPNLVNGTSVLSALRKGSDQVLDVHLMVTNPDDTADWYIDAGADIVTVHQEAARDLGALIDHIHSRGVKAGVVINPATPVEVLTDYVARVDLVLIMSVNPGFGGQGFIEGSIEKVAALRALCDRMGADPLIEVDGGVSLKNARELARAGATVLVAGSAVFGAPDPADMVRQMREVANLGMNER